MGMEKMVSVGCEKLELPHDVNVGSMKYIGWLFLLENSDEFKKDLPTCFFHSLL